MALDFPTIGDVIEMPPLGRDVLIEVASVAAKQPYFDKSGAIVIVDSYGDRHFVVKENNIWVAKPAPLSSLYL